MPAYLVLTQERTIDQAALDIYAQMAPAAGAGRKLRRVVFHGEVTILEGAPFDHTVILEFPTVNDARDWYDSPIYQEALAFRKAGADSRVFIVEGVS